MRSSFRRLLIGSVALVLALTGIFIGISRQRAHADTQATFYVSPTNGSDTDNSGTDSDHPFATIDRARQAVATVNDNMSGDIIVNLLGGTYTQSQTLAFTQSDSGTNGFNVIYQANGYGSDSPDQVTISGGQAITGWSLYDEGNNIYRANVGTDLNTRQLFVNGARATRATTNTTFPGTLTKTDTGYTTTDTGIQSWANPTAIEADYRTSANDESDNLFRDSRCDVASITGDDNGTTITMRSPCFQNLAASAKPIYIENAFPLLSQPGQWYLDHEAGYLYYIPRAGEDLASATVIAPTVENIISGQGTIDAPLHNVQFRGVTFAYSTWLEPNTDTGFAEVESNLYYTGFPGNVSGGIITSAVALNKVHDMRFERDVFTHLGGAGLGFDIAPQSNPNAGSQNNAIIGNVFTDISGNGLQVGDAWTNDPSDGRLRNSGNTIADNYIHDDAVEFRGGSGIVLGYTAGTTVTHNDVENLPYTGIAFGLLLTGSYMQFNRITDNLVVNVMTTLSDGGGIYTRSNQGTSLSNGLLIDGNVLHDIQNTTLNTTYGVVNTFYTDNQSQYITITNNVMYNNASFSDWGSCGLQPHGDFDFEYNYYQKPLKRWYCSTPNNVTEQNNTLITDVSEAPQDIVNNAGLEADYQNIKG